MYPSYSSYKNDIISFNSEGYIQNLKDSTSYDFFLNFLENYKEIENEDFKKPIFSQTTKFKKIPSNYKNYKYLKINREVDEIKNKWIFEGPSDESEKISILIKTYLNKISQDTYKKISTDFLNELNTINNDNINLFEILSCEILNKCIFDNKYRNLYINLCYKIWTNKQLQCNLVNITNKDDKYYWSYKNSKINSILYGPFLNEIGAKNDLSLKISFKKYFLNYIQKLYKNKDLSFEDLNDEDFYIKKKKILLMSELISIIFLEKYINFDIINIIIIDLLHLNNNFDDIEEIEFEALYMLLKLIKDNKNNYNDLLEYKNIFNEFSDIIKKIVETEQLSKRSVFFLSEILSMFNLFSNTNYKEFTYKNIIDDTNYKSDLIKKIKNNNFIDVLDIYEKINNDDKFDSTKKIIEHFIGQTKINENICTFLIDIKKEDLIFDILEKIVENIGDIMLDIPTADKKIIYIIEKINNNHHKKDLIINIINSNIDSDDASDASDASDDTSDDSQDDMQDNVTDNAPDDMSDMLSESDN